MLLSDTANLSQFVRYSGLSEEIRAALELDARNSSTHTTHLSARLMGEIDEMLSKIRPTTVGIDSSYDATANLGETGSGASHHHSSSYGISDSRSDIPTGRPVESLFRPFSPSQADYDNMIDDIRLNSDRAESPKVFFNLADMPPVKAPWEGAGLTSGALCLVLASLVGVLLFGFFVLLN